MSRSQSRPPVAQSPGDVPLEGSASACDHPNFRKTRNTLETTSLLFGCSQSVASGNECSLPVSETGSESFSLFQAQGSSLASRRQEGVDGLNATNSWGAASCLESYCSIVDGDTNLAHPITIAEFFPEETVKEKSVENNVPFALETLFLSSSGSSEIRRAKHRGRVQSSKCTESFGDSGQGSRLPVPLSHVHCDQSQSESGVKVRSETKSKPCPAEAMQAWRRDNWPATQPDTRCSQRQSQQQIELKEFRLSADSNAPEAAALVMDESRESPPDAVARPVKVISKPSIGIHLKGISSTSSDTPNCRAKTVLESHTVFGVSTADSGQINEDISSAGEVPPCQPRTMATSRSSLNGSQDIQRVCRSDRNSDQIPRRSSRLETRRALLESMRFVSPLKASRLISRRADFSLVAQGGQASGATRESFPAIPGARELTTSQVISASLYEGNGSEATGKRGQLGLSTNTTSAISGASATRGSWQSSLVYSSKTYSSLDHGSLVFYLRMVTLFESRWTSIQPMPPATSNVISTLPVATQQQVMPAGGIGFAQRKPATLTRRLLACYVFALSEHFLHPLASILYPLF